MLCPGLLGQGQRMWWSLYLVLRMGCYHPQPLVHPESVTDCLSSAVAAVHLEVSVAVAVDSVAAGPAVDSAAAVECSLVVAAAVLEVLVVEVVAAAAGWC